MARFISYRRTDKQTHGLNLNVQNPNFKEYFRKEILGQVKKTKFPVSSYEWGVILG